MGLRKLDEFALQAARDLALAQPRCEYSGYSIFQLPPLITPGLSDQIPVAHTADGNTYGATLQAIGALIGSGGPTQITATTDFSSLTIYNYGTYNGLPANTAAANDTAMLNMLSFAQANNSGQGGGLLLFQGSQYSIDGVGGSQTGGYVIPSNTLMLGAGALCAGTGSATGQVPATFTITSSSTAATGALFQTAGAGAGAPHSIGGSIIKNVGFSMAPGAVKTFTVVNLNGESSIMEDCAFYDCPTACTIGSLHGGLNRCHLFYQNPVGSGPNGTNNTTGIIPQIIMTGGPFGFVTECEMQQQPTASNGCTGIACISFVGSGGTQGLRISHNDISAYDVGLTFAASNNNQHEWIDITNNTIRCATYGIYMSMDNSTGGTGNIGAVRVIGNTIFQTQNATNITPCVVINPFWVGNKIDDVEFTNNAISGSLSYGVELDGGTNIRFTGGIIAGNSGAGVNITSFYNSTSGGCPGDVLFNGVTFAGKYPTGNTTYTQPYGIQINLSNLASTSRVLVTNCVFGADLGTGPIVTTGSLTSGAIFEIKNCIGYNDQSTIVNTLANISAGTAYRANNQSGNGGTSYFGPSIVMITASASASMLQIMGGVAQTLLANQVLTIYLPHPNDSFQINTNAPAHLMWIGV